MTAPEVFASFTPYPGSQAGVSIATGMVDAASGRASIVTAPGAGDAPRVKVFRYDLFTPTARVTAAGGDGRDTPAWITGSASRRQTAEFLAYDEGYTGGVSLATRLGRRRRGWCEEHRHRPARWGRARWRCGPPDHASSGEPAMYLESPDHHAAAVDFAQIASFAPFPAAAGVTVATTSTTTGADLLVSTADASGSSVVKLALGRADPSATTLAPALLATLPALPGAATPAALAGR